MVALKAGDIDSKRMLLPVERDKGGKSLPSRKRGTAMRCCRHSCSNCWVYHLSNLNNVIIFADLRVSYGWSHTSKIATGGAFTYCV